MVTTVTTTGSNDYLYAIYGDESTTQASHTPTPASFTEVQFDNTHIDGTGEWKNATAQTLVKIGWDIATANTTVGVGVVAFTNTPAGGGTSANGLTFNKDGLSRP